jgi:hypothetical protein
MVWTGRILSWLVALFLFVDGAARLARIASYVEGTVRFGYPEYQARWIGLALVLCTLLYVFPRTTVLGAILITGYLLRLTKYSDNSPGLCYGLRHGTSSWSQTRL